MPIHVAFVARVHVVMVEPKHEGNVGAIARVMTNFGVSSLRIVRPPPLGEEARRGARGAPAPLPRRPPPPVGGGPRRRAIPPPAVHRAPPNGSTRSRRRPWAWTS